MSGLGPIGGGYAAIVERAAAQRQASTAKIAKRASARIEAGTSSVKQLLSSGGAGGAQAPLETAPTDLLSSLRRMESQGDKLVIDLASGKDVNIHNTLIEMGKADIALKYTVQLRNRALSAYEELMRIQI